MAFEGELGFLAGTARRGIEDLRAQLRELERDEEQSTYRGRELAVHVEETLAAITAEIERLEGRFVKASDAARLAIVTEMRFLNHQVQYVHEATPWLESAQESRLALGVTYFIDEAVEAVVQRSAGVVAPADPVYMYSTYSWPFRALLKELGAPLTREPVPIILFYPAQEAASLLFHPIFVHELGHTAIDEHDLAEQVVDNDPDKADFAAAYASAVAAFAAEESLQPAEAAALIDESLAYWLEEVICDALALLYLGPSYMLSFAAFGLSMSRSEPSDAHPPLTLRLGLLLRALEFDGWLDLLRPTIPRMVAWLEDLASTPAEPTSRAIDFLRDAMVALWPTVYREMKVYLHTGVYDPAAFRTVAAAIDERLKLWILPAQLEDGSPPDRRALLLAGWLHLVRGAGDDPTEMASILKRRRFHEFLSKALEMSAVAENWIPIGTS